MIFRQFVEQMKDASEALASGLRGGRDLTPMLHLESEDSGVWSVPLDPRFFEDDLGRQALTELVARIVGVRRTKHVAWTFTGTERTRIEGEDWRVEDVLVAVAIDREREEVWMTRLLRHDDRPARLLGWEAWPANRQHGFLVDRVQEALR